MKRRTLTTALALTGLLGVGGCGSKIESPEIFNKGRIQAESFYPKSSFNGDDRYTTIIKLLPEMNEYFTLESLKRGFQPVDLNFGATFNFNDEARVLDLIYNVGDTVFITESGKDYKIVNPLRR